MSGRWNRLLRLVVFVTGLLAGECAFGQLIQPSIQPGDKLSSLNIVLTRFGPWPKEYVLPSNVITLVVQNYTGTPNDTFSIRTAIGGAGSPSLLDLHSTVARHRDYATIQLVPGSYVMTFAAHPDWQIAITITSAVQK